MFESVQDSLSDSDSVDIEPANACMKNPLLQLPRYFKNFKLLPTKNLMKSSSASPCPPCNDEESAKLTRLTPKPHSYPLIPVEDVNCHAHRSLKMCLITAFVYRPCFTSKQQGIYSGLTSQLRSFPFTIFRIHLGRDLVEL